MAVCDLLRLRADATAEHDADGRASLVEGHVRAPLGELGPGLREALALLCNGGATAEEVCAAAAEVEGVAAIFKANALVARLERGGWLQHAIRAGERALVTVRPLGHELTPVARGLPGSVVLSRFAHMRVVDGELVLETPRVPVRVIVQDAGALALLAALARPGAPTDVVVDGLDLDATAALLEALLRARIVVDAEEESTRGFVQWSFADLLFHQRSRIGHHVGDFGGSFRFKGRLEPLPAVREPREPAIALHVPDLDGGADQPLTAVLEARASVRVHDDERPITVEQLGEFLYRCARNRAVFSDGVEEVVSRPYPAGGSLHELELYPLVHHVAGLEPGLYHYDPQAHALGLVSLPGPQVTLLLEYGRRTAVMDSPPQVVLLVAARFGRMMWKYESMAYAATLKHVGVLYQTMYLVATAMGLAPCALGGGNANGFAAAAGTDPCEEATVGEFVLGSRLPAA